MSSTHDTFNSKKTTPFERRGIQRETFDSKTTTPFERRGLRREASSDVDTSEFDDVTSEPRRAIPWMFIACVAAVVGAVLWSTGISF